MKLTTLLTIGILALWNTVAGAATITFNTAADFTGNFTAIQDAATLRHNPTMKAMRTTTAGTSVFYYSPGGNASSLENGSISTTFQTSQFHAYPSVALFARTDLATSQGLFAIANLNSANQIRFRLGAGDTTAGSSGYLLDMNFTPKVTISTSTTFRLTLDVRNVTVGTDTFAEMALSMYDANTNSLICESGWVRVNTTDSFTTAGAFGLRAYTTPATLQLSLYDFTVVGAIPEPSTTALGGLAGLGLLGGWLMRRRSSGSRVAA